MLPNTAPKPADTTQAGALRVIPGGYDVTRWPIHVPRAPGETLPGWLLRLAYRYGTTPISVLTDLGLPVLPQRRPRLATLTAQHPDVFTTRLGLRAADLTEAHSPLAKALHELDTEYWIGVRGLQALPTRSASRWCPSCLANDSTWQDTWTHPLHVACLTHQTLLVDHCPRCLQAPFKSVTWLTHNDDPRACPAFDATMSGHRYRNRCAARLDHIPAAEATESTLNAQRLLFALAADALNPHASLTAAGLTVSARVAYDALLEIVGSTPFVDTGDRDKISVNARHALETAAGLLTAPTLTDAADTARHLPGFGPQEDLAPLGTPSQARRRQRNPLLIAIGLRALQGRITLGAELTFQLGGEAPSYPAAWDAPVRPLHRQPARPPLPMAAIPQQLWPGALAADQADPSGLNTPIGRAFAAVALARYGSDRPWRVIAVNLGLPAGAAVTGARLWRSIDRAGLWPDYLHAIDTLFQQLHEHPPPIDYERRRLIATDPEQIRWLARTVLSKHLGPQQPDRARTGLARAFWETYTGGHHSLGPGYLPRARSQPSNDDHPTGEPISAELILELADRLEAIHGSHRDEPLTWRPP